MAEYVTKEQVKEEILNWARCINKPERLVTEDTMYVIDALPVADVRPVVRGKWVRTYGDSRFMCSVCKGKESVPTIMGEPTVWDYCPNCGADMRGGEAE